MNWVFLVLGVIFAIPPLWTWQKLKAKELTKMSRKTFFICSGFALFFILCYVALSFSKEATAAVIVLMDLGFFVSLVLTIYYAVKSKKQKEDYKNKLKYSSITTIGFFALFGLLIMNLANNGESYKNSASSEPKKEQTKSTTKSSTKKTTSDEKEEDNDQLTKSEVKKINKQLVKDLKDDQDDATNGNKNYDWANWVLKITINEDWQATVYVDGGFTKLSEAARNEVASHTNGLIGRSIVTAGVDYSPEKSREGIFINFHNGSQILGNSRFTDHSSIKWNKRYFK